MSVSPFKGPLFENLIISDFHKQSFNTGNKPSLYFWRDHNGRIEVDCIVDKGTHLTPIEIKSSATLSPHFFDQLNQWNILAGNNPHNSYVIYGGTTNQKRSQGHIMSWHDTDQLIEDIITQEK